jgi:hypothetical protein
MDGWVLGTSPGMTAYGMVEKQEIEVIASGAKLI